MLLPDDFERLAALSERIGAWLPAGERDGIHDRVHAERSGRTARGSETDAREEMGVAVTPLEPQPDDPAIARQMQGAE